MLPAHDVTQNLPLAAVMSHKAAMDYFLTFVKRDHSEENLLFWLDVEKMRNISQPKQLGHKAAAVWKTYFHKDSKLALTIDGNTFEALKGKFERAVFGPFLFAKAQGIVGDVLRQDLHLKFIGSDEYQDMLRHLAFLLQVQLKRSNNELSFEEVLANPLSYDAFRKYLVSLQLGQGDVLLLNSTIAVFKQRKMADFELNQYAEFICRHFFSTDPPRVNCLEQKEVEEVLQVVKKGRGKVKLDIFDGIQNCCLTVLQKHFDSFRESNEYESLLKRIDTLAKEATDAVATAAQSDTQSEQKRALHTGVSSTTVTVSDVKSSQSASVVSDAPRLPIRQVLNSVDMLEAFLRFAQAEGDDNAILFWMEAEHHRELPPDRLVPKAYALFKKFLKPKAEKFVPVSKEIIDRMRARLLKKDAVHVFEEAQADVLERLEHGELFNHFLQTPEYAALVMRATAEDNQGPCCILS